MIDNKEVDRRRRELDISKAELSRRLNMKADMTLIRKLNGISEWKFDEIWLLSQVLDCEISDLVKKGDK